MPFFLQYMCFAYRNSRVDKNQGSGSLLVPHPRRTRQRSPRQCPSRKPEACGPPGSGWRREKRGGRGAEEEASGPAASPRRHSSFMLLLFFVLIKAHDRIFLLLYSFRNSSAKATKCWSQLFLRISLFKLAIEI